MSQRPPSDQLPQAFEFRILAIDGGGIRGVIPARLLERLEALLAAELSRRRAAGGAGAWEGIAEPRIADCFHLIAGTSTGGLLAAGLTTSDNDPTDPRPKLTAAEAADVYRTHGRKIFHRPVVRNVLDHFELVAPKYPLAQLRAALEDPAVLGDGLLADARTEVLILAYDTRIPAPRYFTRWGAPGAGDTPLIPTETMVEVALATSAAPTYFEPETIGPARLMDGGVYAGNPALAAIAMALRRTQEPVPRTAADLFMVSLGTGAWSQALDYGDGGIIGWLAPEKGGEPLLEALLGGSGSFVDEAAHLFLNGHQPPAGTTWEPNLPAATLGGGPQLWRYQPPLPEPFALDDAGSLPALEAIAAEQNERYAAELERLAGLLVEAGPVPA